MKYTTEFAAQVDFEDDCIRVRFEDNEVRIDRFDGAGQVEDTIVFTQAQFEDLCDLWKRYDSDWREMRQRAAAE